MSDKSGIEWTDATFNPWWGCEKVSPACTHCYAEGVSNRFAPGHWGKGSARRFFGDKHWDEPRKWNRRAEKSGQPYRVFSGSMCDIFELRPDLEPHRKRLFALIIETPHLTWQLLTKRVENVMKLTPRGWASGFPKNVMIGTTAETQKWADARIPELCRIPAMRFVSMEPLLGSVDIGKWVKPIPMMFSADAPETWAEVAWPAWVPEKVREQIADFWGPSMGRKPKDWLHDSIAQGSPPFGQRMSYQHQPGAPTIEGMWIHTWNNMGRLIDKEGRDHVVSTPKADLFDHGPGSASFQGLHWVIVGGESGRGARPTHPDWIRSIRDQCQVAGVPFHFKQWGEWEPVPQGGRDRLATRRMMWPDGAMIEPQPTSPAPGVLLERVGKKAAGRILDGRTWDERPEAI